jgi:DNA repair protein RadC
METTNPIAPGRWVDKTKMTLHKPKPGRRKLDATLARLRVLHEELNAELYSHPSQRPQIQSPQDAANLLTPFIGYLEHEELWVVTLDTRSRLKSLNMLYKGNVSSSQVRVAEVFRGAVIENAPSIIIAHNHPSEDPTPSPDDVAVTRAIVQAGRLLNVEVLDHLVICRDRYMSLKERSLGFG